MPNAATLVAHNGDFVNVRDAYEIQAIDGAVVITPENKNHFVTKAGVCALTVADPTAGLHDGTVLRFVATTANAHTLSNAAGSGFNAGGATKDVATFGGAIGDGLTIVAYGGKWHLVASTNITLG
jgi:hypothetical protein